MFYSPGSQVAHQTVQIAPREAIVTGDLHHPFPPPHFYAAATRPSNEKNAFDAHAQLRATHDTYQTRNFAGDATESTGGWSVMLMDGSRSLGLGTVGVVTARAGKAGFSHPTHVPTEYSRRTFIHSLFACPAYITARGKPCGHRHRASS